MTELDQLERHPLITRLRRSLSQRPGTTMDVEDSARRAAILVALRARSDGEPELLMIKRAEFSGDPWSGHVAWPGGRMEPTDVDLAVTALRETLEETGVDIARDGRVLGHLDELRPRGPLQPSMVIRPYVALVRADVCIVPSHEVAAVFWVPLSALRVPASWRTETVQVQGVDRSVSVFQHGGYTVWGLTERVLRQFLAYVGEAKGNTDGTQP